MALCDRIFYPPPKDFIYNSPGVSANPGSREFHAYRAARRIEYGRLKTIEVADGIEDGRREFQEKIDTQKEIESQKTAKKREKRNKKKKARGGKSQAADKESGNEVDD